ncbi:Sin3 family co-repressor-domain-containing protein [Chlamydoabsidia padenii]|nr:Sin3 family co-repressor-domain-containing protein [Chlamydoabsidia padenii]
MTDPTTVRADSLHPQHLGFGKDLKTQKLYHTPAKKPIKRISLILSPTKSIVKKVHRLSSTKPSSIPESVPFPPRNQHNKDVSFMNDTEHSHILHEQSNTKIKNNYILESANNNVNMERKDQGKNGDNTRNNGGIGNSNNKGWNGITSSSNHGDKGSDNTDDNDDDYTSDLRSTLSSNQQRESRMTLEGRSLQGLLQQGRPRLLHEIYQHIGHQDTFQSFLELLDMYDTQLIDHLELVQRLNPFLGRNKYLLERFKQGIMEDRMGDDDQLMQLYDSSVQAPFMTKHNNNNSDTDSVSAISVLSSTSITSSHHATNRNKDNNTSYRWIPKGLRNENCSGRDNTCWEVLNDQYVSHPTWASEDNGFLSSNKSKAEEKLHQVEDERYALDIEISTNSDVLALMEGYLKQILDMSIDQQRKVKLCPENDGYSSFGYTQVIKKVYHTHEKQDEILTSLLSSPATVLPGFIKLMKQRDADLRKQKQEKQLVWNDTVAKNYYKFLDYQWENNKAEGRKPISTQQLITEIDTLWHEQQLQLVLQQQQERSQRLLTSSNPPPRLRPLLSLPPPQLVYDFRDSSIINDICDLLRTSSSEQYSIRDTTAIRRFIDEYIPPLFGILLRPTELNDSSSSKTKAPIKTRSQQQRQGHHYQPKQRTKYRPPSACLATLESRLFIGDAHWYCMIRYFQMIYESLSRIKSIDESYRVSPHETKRKYAALVDLYKESYLLGFVEIDLTQGYYYTALQIIQYFLNGKLDQHGLEDGIRYLFGVQAYVAFNIGNKFGSLMQQVHHITTDPNLKDLFNLFQTYQPYRPKAIESIIQYRSEANIVLGLAEKKFMMIVDGRTGTLCLQIIGDHEMLIPEHIKDYLAYIESYRNRKRKTVGVKRKNMGKVFLNRNLEKENKRAISNVYLHQGLNYEVCQETYHLGFVEGTEDLYARQTI